ncbi:MAG: DUF3306 domain-containing protein [Pseudomonadota bacterium]
MAEEDEGRFLSRWARLKQEEKDAGHEPPPPETAKEVAERPEEIDEEARAKLIAELPDIETLEESSDFTAFLQAGVPEELRRRALRKLWRLNPVFANLDGLNDYDEDFTDAATVVQGLKTLYQVGKGMVTPEEEAAESELAESEVAEGEPEEVSPAPETAEPCAPESVEQEVQTAEATPLEAPEPVGPIPPANAAKRRWGRFESET